jgi:hypothetical protein
MSYDEDDLYPPSAEAEEICPLLPAELAQPGTVWPCRVCGLELERSAAKPLAELGETEPLSRCLSETVRFLSKGEDHART